MSWSVNREEAASASSLHLTGWGHKSRPAAARAATTPPPSNTRFQNGLGSVLVGLVELAAFLLLMAAFYLFRGKAGHPESTTSRQTPPGGAGRGSFTGPIPFGPGQQDANPQPAKPTER